jgi:hypothetical protein
MGRALALVVALSGFAGACGTGQRTRRLPASVFAAARLEARAPQPPARRGDEGAALVERALRQAGLRFGTDGSTRALWGYLRTAHELVDPAAARPGDVIFFDVWGVAHEPSCADLAGVVEAVDRDGRIRFIEQRDGRVRHSFVSPARPIARRDADGRVLNSFLRPKLIGEPAGARHFAGEMVCAVARVTHR